MITVPHFRQGGKGKTFSHDRERAGNVAGDVQLRCGERQWPASCCGGRGTRADLRQQSLGFPSTVERSGEESSSCGTALLLLLLLHNISHVGQITI